jgi:hypothetical protein
MKRRERLSERIARERQDARQAAFAEACRVLKWDMVLPDEAEELWAWFKSGMTKPESGHGIAVNGIVPTRDRALQSLDRRFYDTRRG